ncbi:hypothetical protein TrLO_g5223 [Triparma laevis f. longispina]|uniref:Uncharacterized protein n=1 Tax=Triparma laevis f. longispina TaxID=1714387 RepID=A0A9W7E222_9STRA|nr:hypothetical protein TrLO_g5223 [Triparma laevis f. longispina]
MDVELKETKAELKAYKAARKEHKAQTEAAREKISSVINALNQKKEALKEPRHDLPFHPSTRHFDSRRKKDFIKNIHSTPALTEDEQNMIGGTMKLVEEVSSRAKRVARTANESVEKFIYHSEEEGGGVGMTVAKMDLEGRKEGSENSRRMEQPRRHKRSAVYYFSRAAGSFLGQAIRVLVNVKMLVDEEGRRTFIVAFAPLNTYDGTHHEVSGEVENALLVN